MFKVIPSSASTFIVLGGLIAIYIPVENTEAALHKLRRESLNKKYPEKTRMVPSVRQHGWRPAPPARHRRLVGPVVLPPWWTTRLPDDNKLCPPLKSQTLDLSCTFEDANVPCGQPMKPGTFAVEKCRYFHTAACEHEAYSLRCLDSGLWDYPLFYCTPDDVCKQDKGNYWTWKTISQCSKAQEDLRSGNVSGACYFSNEDPYICCEPITELITEHITKYVTEPITIHITEPITKPITEPITEETDKRTELEPQPGDRKSSQMCKKYAESVSKPTKAGAEKSDTCALIEPIDATVPEDSGYIPERNAEPREFPHTAVLGYGDKSHKRPRVRCAGSLISERYVISLARCAKTSIGPAAWVRLGDYNINSNVDDIKADSQSEIYDIEERILHPEYKLNHDPNEIYYHDVALYKLSGSVKFNEYIRPICLHAGDQFAKTFALTTGWGPVKVGERPSDILQKANVTIVEDEKCSDGFKFYGEVRDGLDKELVVCAGFLDGSDSCTSVDGSPLQIRLREPYCMYSLVGVAYFGRGCHVKSPGVYVRVSRYLDWIESIVWA